MDIEVINGIGEKKFSLIGYSFKGISVKGMVDRIEILINGNIVYRFENTERLSEFSDNTVDIPLFGETTLRIYGNDGVYKVKLFLEPILRISSKGAYEELKLTLQ